MDRLNIWRIICFVIATLAALDTGGAMAAQKRGHSGSCRLHSDHGNIQHVIFLIFDNVHFLRDNPNVPSDPEQMPNLLNFIRCNGTLLTNNHTVLISHTANGILTNLTGMYSDRHGQSVANSYRFFKSDGTTGSSSSFKYWTDSTDGGNAATGTPSGDSHFNMVNGDSGSPKNTPAPWVPYTRAGCDFGATALANIVLENNNAVVFAAGPTTLAAAASAGVASIKVASVSGFLAGQTITLDLAPNDEQAVISNVGTAGASGTGITLTAALTKAHASASTVFGPTATDPAGDMTKVFGEGSPEWNEGKLSQTAPALTALRSLAQTDFVGIAVHCAKTPDSICAGNAHARPDLLPDEPRGYNGYLGLFGAKYVNPAINHGSASLNDLNGQPITDQFDQPGFPGFDGLFASTTLAYVAQMQEAGIPITFGYISDAHDQHGLAGEIHATRGPGEADYVQQLKNYDEAFGKFFDRLAAHGIDKSNTLFVFTVEEGDHFVGSQPTDPNCNGVTTPCTYSLVGEVNGNLTGLLATQQQITTPFTVHSDMSPTIYLTGNPLPTSSVARAFGRALSKLTTVNPYTGALNKLTAALADPVAMDMLHMVTADPQRTPTLTMFAHPDYFLFTGAANCSSPCITVPTTPPTSTFAWNHGSIDPEIATIWLGLVGPGVTNGGQDDSTWSDHTYVRPTMLSLLGLQDTYVHDGRVLTEIIEKHAQPVRLRGHTHTLRELASIYKQINAPFGQLGMDTLKVSTAALASGDSTSDALYTALSNKIMIWTDARDALAAEMKGLLDGAAFYGEVFDQVRGRQLINQAKALLTDVSSCAAEPTACAQ